MLLLIHQTSAINIAGPALKTALHPWRTFFDHVINDVQKMAAVERSVYVAGQAVAIDTELSVVDVGLGHGGAGAVVPAVPVPLSGVRNVQCPEAW